MFITKQYTTTGSINRYVVYRCEIVKLRYRKEQTGSQNVPDNSQFLRLFLVVPKTSTEADLLKYFSEFGLVDSVTIVKDRETKESKGYAYVKYKL